MSSKPKPVKSIKLGFIIPTLNRFDKLNSLLQSIYGQSFSPDCVIVVDGSKESVIDRLVRSKTIELIYIHSYPPSLTRQRNRGIDRMPENLTHVGFLDDDVILKRDSIKNLVEFIRSKCDSDLGGVSFNIVSESVTRFVRVKRILGIYPESYGKISVGASVQPQINAPSEAMPMWLCGGCTVWNIEVFKEHRFDEWYKGYALWEDVDFSYRVGQKWKLYIAQDAHIVDQNVNQSSNTNWKKVGDLEVIDRFYFIQKHRDSFSKISGIKAVVGTILWNFQYSIRCEIRAMARVWGNVLALSRVIWGKVERGE